jgi:hypothetical protein
MIKRLADLSQEEMKEIAGRNKSGEVLIVTHPFCVRENIPFEQFIRAKGFEKQLTLIMEEHSNITELRKKLAELGVESSVNLFLVRTKYAEVVPIMGWRKFLRRLREMSVREATVDGRFLTTGTIEELKFKERFFGKTKRLSKLQRLKLMGYLRLLKRDVDTSGRDFVRAKCVGNLCAKLNADKRFKARIRRHFA